jgi:hypothetical protein
MIKKMKYINKIILSILAIVAPLAACDTEELTDLNINPQALNEVNLNFIFTAVELSSATNGFSGDNWYLNGRTNLGYTAYFMQQLATTGIGLNNAGDKYFDNTEAWEAPWDFWYGDMVKQMRIIFKQSGEGGFEEGRRKNMVAATKVLWALTFHRLTDFYGNLPYSEAGQGVEGLFAPKYDTQQEIYMDLFQKLTEATQELSDSNPDEGFSTADFVYNGDIDKWKKFANSLMLRMAMRISDVDPANANKYVTQAIQGGVMTSNDDNYVVPLDMAPSIWINQNGLSREFIDGSHNRTLSKTLIDFLKGTDPNDVADDDPRLMIITSGFNGNTDPLDQVGMPNGLDGQMLDVYTGIDGSVPRDLFSQLNEKFLQLDESYMVMNVAEVELLMAEAKERGIGTVPGTAKEHYEKGVKHAMQMYTVYDESFVVSDDAVEDYLAAHPYTEGGADAEKMIGYQMWVSKFMNWWDSWSDWRRTGYPELVPVNYAGSASPGYIPTKLRIPNRELATNLDNYTSGATKPDDPKGKVWWDVN